MCDENTVGTFINLGFEDDRTGESCLLEEQGRGWTGPKDSLAQDRHIPPAGELTSCLPMSVLRKAHVPHCPL